MGFRRQTSKPKALHQRTMSFFVFQGCSALKALPPRRSARHSKSGQRKLLMISTPKRSPFSTPLESRQVTGAPNWIRFAAFLLGWALLCVCCPLLLLDSGYNTRDQASPPTSCDTTSPPYELNAGCGTPLAKICSEDTQHVPHCSAEPIPGQLLPGVLQQHQLLLRGEGFRPEQGAGATQGPEHQQNWPR
jgi:hypothetical protein